MGRALGKTEIKRIENEVSRNVSFRKRRRGLLKKAEELSILCDATVGVVVFSPAGKLSEYSSTYDFKTIIGRYMKCLGHEENINCKKSGSNSSHARLELKQMDDIAEVTKLHQHHQELEHEYRKMSGEDLGGINLRELEELQDHLEIALKRVKSRQSELYTKDMTEIQSKGLELVEEHAMLRHQLTAFLAREAADDEERQPETTPQYKFL